MPAPPGGVLLTRVCFSGDVALGAASRWRFNWDGADITGLGDELTRETAISDG